MTTTTHRVSGDGDVGKTFLSSHLPEAEAGTRKVAMRRASDPERESIHPSSRLTFSF